MSNLTFSNGTEFLIWAEFNCYLCRKSVQCTCGTELPTCSIERALLVACIGDGMVTQEIKSRMDGGVVDGRRRCGEFEEVK